MVRAKAPGKPVQDWQRHTRKVQIRCTPELADRARYVADSRGVTLADVLLAGVEAAAGWPCKPVVSTLTALRDEQDAAAELRADMHDDRDQ